MKRRWLYLLGCLLLPHIMLFVGIIFLSRRDAAHASFGMTLCKLSTSVLIAGSVIYLLCFMPHPGVD